MTFSNFVSVLRRWAQRDADSRQSGLLAVQELRGVFARERARSDRTGDRFCLLVLAPPEGAMPVDFHQRLTSVLRSRLRLIDEAGWLDQRRLAVVLPATSPRGAWKLAADVCEKLDPRPACRVYCYPSEASQLDRSIGERRRSVADPSPSDAFQLDESKPHAHRAGDEEPPVDALESLFVQALPAWKRTIDIIGAVLGLIVLSPVFLVLAIAIKLTSVGPIFFRQWRTGRGGQPFLMYKFRTMVIDAEDRKSDLLPFNEQDGPAFKITADPRVTHFGRVLRNSSLDELPQLWNVLRGEMSLVGPRPLPCAETDNCLDWQRGRLDVTPGLTCIWQVRGRSQVTFNDWVRMDLEYVERRTFWHDLKILLATVPAVLQRRGAK